MGEGGNTAKNAFRKLKFQHVATNEAVRITHER
jgi:hypothetical protein